LPTICADKVHGTDSKQTRASLAAELRITVKLNTMVILDFNQLRLIGDCGTCRVARFPLGGRTV